MHDGIHSTCALQPRHSRARSGRRGSVQGLPGWQIPERERRDGVRAVWKRQLLPGRLISAAAVPGWDIFERHWSHEAKRVHRLPGRLVMLNCLTGAHAMCSGDSGAQSKEPQLHRL